VVVLQSIPHGLSSAELGLGDGGRVINLAWGAEYPGKDGNDVFRSSTDAASVINGVADSCPWPMMLTVNMGSEFLNRQMEISGSEYGMRAEYSGASTGRLLNPRDETERLPRQAEPVTSWQANGLGIGGQREVSVSQQMILQKQVMERCDINFASVASEQTPGLPLWKRALDLAVIVAVLPGLLILGGLTALLVICGSRGPVFFRQRRVGHKGREFDCFKFRTMQVNADTKSHQDHFQQLMQTEVPMTKLDARSDPRLIPFGAIVRACGLDELPQLLNVVRGEMSLVGPRPCIPYEYELYEPWQRRRFDAVPGLTGLWQVSGKNRTTFNEMIRLDINYSENVSLWLDLKIILKTLPAILQQCRESRALKRTQTARASAGMAKSVELCNL
jgi:exopolysaccharide production protein ExoY